MRLIEFLCGIISDGVREFGIQAVCMGLAAMMSWMLIKLGFRRKTSEGKLQEEEHVKTAPPKAEDPASRAAYTQPLPGQDPADEQFRIGEMYYWGDGVRQDRAEAFKWYVKAARQGHSGAQVRLGVMYYRGDGIEQDKAKALEWYSEAARQGDVQAQVILTRLSRTW